MDELVESTSTAVDACVIVIANEHCSNTFIMSSKSDSIMLHTASAPTTPSNVRVTSCTANAIQVSWVAPDDGSVQVLGMFTV